MHKLSDVRKALNAGEMDEALARLTCSARPCRSPSAGGALLDGFERSFGRGEDTPVTLCSAPGPHGKFAATTPTISTAACWLRR